MMEKVVAFLTKYGIYIHGLAVIVFVFVVQQNLDREPRDNVKLGIVIALLALAVFNLASAVIAKKKNRKP